MTIAELIEQLQTMPPHAPVRVVQADDDGYYDVEADSVTWEGNHVRIEST